MKVSLKNMLGETLTIGVNGDEETVRSLMAKVREKYPGLVRSSKVRLVFDGRQLSDKDRTLAHYNVTHNSTLDLVPCLSERMQLVSVRNLSDDTLTINVNVDEETVRSLMAKLREKYPGFAPSSQVRFIHAGRRLFEKDRTLAHYNVTNNSTLHLVLCLCGC